MQAPSSGGSRQSEFCNLSLVVCRERRDLENFIKNLYLKITVLKGGHFVFS